jgi:prepilin-type N-terminal cleavage/methylation domain-containing protein
MPARLRKEDGFGLIELIAAMAVLSIALLALLAGYGAAVVSLRASSQKTTASAIAGAQLELYRALPYASIGLDADAVTAAEANDTLYSADHTSLDDPNPISAGVDSTIAGCGTSPQCTPIQTVTGADHNTYRVETFVRDVQDQNSSSITWTERVVTVIIRDPRVTGTPIILEVSSAFDRGSGG